MAEEVVLRIGTPERVLLRVTAEKGFDAFQACTKWCRHQGISAANVMVVSTPFGEDELSRGIVGYDQAPVWDLSKNKRMPKAIAAPFRGTPARGKPFK